MQKQIIRNVLIALVLTAGFSISAGPEGVVASQETLLDTVGPQIIQLFPNIFPEYGTMIELDNFREDQGAIYFEVRVMALSGSGMVHPFLYHPDKDRFERIRVVVARPCKDRLADQ